jgi:integrase
MTDGEGPKRGKIGLAAIRALPPNTQIFDTGPGAVPAFGARRRVGSAVSYFVMFRTGEGRQRLYTIGQHGAPWTPDTAREKALAVLADVKLKGGDPSAAKRTRREAATVADLCDVYWSEAESGRLLTRRKTPKKPSTLQSDKGRLEKHVKPLLGKLKVAAVTSADVEAFMHAVAAGKTAARAKTGKKHGLSNVRGGPGVASRTVGLLGAVFSFAVKHRMRADNPVWGVMRPADGRRERRLSDAEYAALGAALRSAEATIWPPAVAVARFLTLTGWRSGEALGLRWADVDLACRTATLPDSKTGKSMRPLSNGACDVLMGLTRGADATLIFPATRGDGTMTGFRKMWDRITKLGELSPDVTPHVMRHSFASQAADLEYSESTIGTLIGHKSASVTGRYVHAADAVMLAAADAVAQRIAELMGDAKPDATVVQLRPAAA